MNFKTYHRAVIFLLATMIVSTVGYTVYVVLTK